MQVQVELIITIGLGAVFLLKLIVDWVISGKVLLHKNKELKDELPPVSIIVCGRNESDNIMQFLPQLLEQDYPNFEVVFVNDRSIDDTHLVIRALQNRYSHLKATRVKHSELHWAGKKFALSMGLKSASNDLVVLTDADCYPSSNLWLKEMVAQFSPRHKIILGYGAYERQGGLINKLFRAEALSIAIQYMGFSKIGFTYMGVGRNMAYDRNLFFDNRGFASHQFIASGDDDLFVNEVARKKNTTIAFSNNSYTISLPENTLRNWIEQKRRHLTTSIRYSAKTSAALLIHSLIYYSFYSISIFSILYSELWWPGALALSLNLISIILRFYTPCKKTQSLDILIWMPISEIFLLLFYPFLFIWNTLSSGSPWKNF